MGIAQMIQLEENGIVKRIKIYKMRNVPLKGLIEKISPLRGKAKGMDGKACWKGYSLRGTKMKNGKKVDNCVKN